MCTFGLNIYELGGKMMSLEQVGDLFKFIGGLGMFLYGMNVMADGLQKTADGKMKQLLGFLTNNRILGVVMGALITAIIQSSSATTVMVVGFVNAGIINLTQAVGVIMGANIGTTITSWLVSMNEWGSALKPEFFAPLIIGIGSFLLMFAKKEKKKDIGEIAVGFGVLFIGLSFMSGSITPYSDAPIFGEAFRVLGGNPILGVLAGAVITGILQSSSASVGILQTLAMTGMVNWNAAIFITLGQNIGTCVTALLSSIGAHKTAKRASIIHLLFNVFGAVIFGVVMFIVFLVNKEFAASPINSVEISIFHTIFNVTNTVLLFPFANLLVKLSGVIIKEDKEEKEQDILEEVKCHLDERIMENPSFAVEAAIYEVVHMGKFVTNNMKLAVEAVLTNNIEEVNQVYENEKKVNKFEKLLTEYLVKIDNLSLSENQHNVIKNLLYSIHDMERVGDHSENIAELAEGKCKEGIVFSESAKADMKEVSDSAILAFEKAIEAREKESVECIRKVVECEDKVDELEEELHEKHLERLVNGKCNVASGVVFLDVVSNLERISDHAMNISGYVQDEL